MPSAQPEFQRVQRAFAAHLRDPAVHAAPPELEDRRLKIYRELFYNNVEDFLATAFPVLRKLSSDAVWHARVRDFYARHESKSPQFYKLAEEFLHFIENERGAHPDDPPFIAELAHYEWVELALSISEAEATPDLGGADTASCVSKGVREAPHRPAPAPTSLRSGTVARVDPNGDLLAQPPVVSPLAWILSYVWPVHRIGPEHQPTEAPAQPTYLVVYRTRQDEVRFMEINAVSARLLQLIEEHPARCGREHLLAIAAELQHPDPEQIVEAGRGMLAGLRERDILLGTRRA